MSRDVWNGLEVFHKTYGSMLGEHFARLCDELERARPKPIDAAHWLEMRAEILDGLREVTGLTSLGGRSVKAKTLGKIERKGYVLERLILETKPGLYATANLYIPSKLEEPAPAILRVHGHWPYGKQQDAVQATCIGLALRGYVAMALDKVGYGERAYQGHAEGYVLPSVGLTLQALELWDNMCAIDYLQSRREVDPERIGCTGASGGGNQTMYLAALDERVKVAAPVCSAEVFEDQVASGRCFCECIPGMLKFANVPEILACIAPRPLLIVSGVLDRVFPITSARKAFSRVRAVYELMGYGERISMFESYSPHGYNREMREAVYKWFDRWLMAVERCEAEPDITVEPVDSEALSCLPTGPPSGAETLYTIYDRRFEGLRKARALSPERWLGEREKLRKRLVEDVFGGFPEKCDLDARVYKVKSLSPGLLLELVSFRSELDIIVPAIVLRWRGKPNGVYVFLSPGGKSSIFADRRVRKVVEDGALALLVDYRGVGETVYDESVAARNSLVLGRHILGMRVFDVLRSLDYLASRGFLGETDVFVHGSSEAGLIALFAAALDTRIDGAVAEGFLATYKLSNPLKQPPSLYPPKIAFHADIPEVAALIAPRRLTLKKPIDCSGVRLTPEKAEHLFGFTREIYDLLGAGESFTLET